MFDNIGGKLKTVAKAVFVLGIIASVILAASLGKDKWGDFSFGSFLLILISGCVVSYLSVMTLYGFGQLIENSDRQTVLLESLQKLQSTDAAPKETISARPSAIVANGWICKKCGTKNSNNSQFCRDCGQFK